MRLRVLVFGAVGALVLLAPSSAWAVDPVISVDKTDVELVKGEDGSWTAKIGVRNLDLTEAVILEADVRPPGSCTIAATPTELPANTFEPVTLRITLCDPSEGVSFGLHPKNVRGHPAIPITLTPKAAKKSFDAHPLVVGFRAGLVGALVVGFISLFAWWANKDNTTESRGLSTALAHLDAGWSFKDSWAATVTTGVSVLAGVFAASNVMKVLLGADADAAIAITVVAAAIAVALVAVAGMIVSTLKSDPDANGDNSVTAGGFVVGAVVVLTAAFGQLYVISDTARKLKLGGLEDLAQPAAIAVAVVIAAYGIRSSYLTLTVGSVVVPDEPAKPSPDATLIADAINALAQTRHLQATGALGALNTTQFAELIDSGQPLRSASATPAAPRPRRRAALI